MVKKSNASNIKPLFDYVLIKPVQEEEMTPSGIVIPDTAKEKPQIGEVIAVGPGRIGKDGKHIPMQVKVGQKVVYKKWGGDEVKVGSDEWLLVKEEDIMAVVEN
ncbi:MAG: 10 kDa chaperonin [Patescibacteria group bacterium]|nr:MAG: 10 kDa chaperonin [Patescibacteria group bacterium]